jgi:hypothetical protein
MAARMISNAGKNMIFHYLSVQYTATNIVVVTHGRQLLIVIKVHRLRITELQVTDENVNGRSCNRSISMRDTLVNFLVRGLV